VKALCILPLLGICALLAAPPDEDGPKTEADRLASPTTRFLDAASAFRYATVVRELRIGQFKPGAEWNVLHTMNLVPETEYTVVAVWGKEAKDVGIQVLDPDNDVIAVQWDQSVRPPIADRDKETRDKGFFEKDKDKGARPRVEEPSAITQVFKFKVRAPGKYTVRVRVREARDPGGECSCYYAVFRRGVNEYREKESDKDKYRDKG
jgi:hypothetical protein